MTKYFFYFLAFFTSYNSYSFTKYLGTDINYHSISNNKVVIEVVNYRNCAYSSFPSSITCQVYNDSFSLSQSLNRVSISPVVSPYCSNVCQPANTNVAVYGVEAHLYTDTIDFGSGNFQKLLSSNFCQVYFSINNCCRIVNLSNENVYVEAMLNTCIWKQSNAVVSTGRFIAAPENRLPAFSTFNYSFAVKGYNALDSVAYQLVKAKTDINTISGLYNINSNKDQFPVDYICKGKGTICSFDPSVNPVYGSNFNSSNGNFTVTPNPQGSTTDAVCKINYYRIVNGSRQVIAYTKREMMMELVFNANNKVPYITELKSYQFKAGVNSCIELSIKDDPTGNQNKQDSVKVKVLTAPFKGELSLSDSNGINKTVRFCATPSAADYMNRKNLDFVLQVNENNCGTKINSIVSTISVEITKPDSFSYFNVRTFEDINQNGLKDPGENWVQSQFYSENKGQLVLKKTDANGYFRDSFHFEYVHYGALQNVLYQASRIYSIDAQFDSTYNIDLALPVRYGIKGIAFLDLNANCVMDVNEPRLSQMEIAPLTENTKCFTDENGNYFLELAPGSYDLKLLNSAYQTTCFNLKQVSLGNNEVLDGIDFPLQLKSNYVNLEVSVKNQPHYLGKTVTQELKVKNNSLKTVKNFQLKLLTDRVLVNRQSSQTTYSLGDTLVWIIDSLQSGKTHVVALSHLIQTGSYQLGNRLNYKLMLMNDSNNSNNELEYFEKVLDSNEVFSGSKVSLSSDKIFSNQKSLVYQLNLKSDKAYGNGFVIEDELDANLFDLTSLRVIDNSRNLKYNLNSNVLIVTRDSAVKIGEEFKFLFKLDYLNTFESIDYIKNSFQVYSDTNLKIFDYFVEDTSASSLEWKGLSTKTVCVGSSFEVTAKANYMLSKDNRFKVYLSDSAGDFSNQQLVLDTLVTNRNFKLKINTSFNQIPGKAYQLKIVGTHPSTESWQTAFKDSIEMLALPLVSVKQLPQNMRLCKGDSFNVRAEGAEKYQYFIDDNAVGNLDTHAVYRFVPNSNFKFAVLGESKAKCQNRSIDYIIEVKDLPLVQFLLSENEVCEGSKTQLQISGTEQYEVYENSTLWKQLNESDTLLTNTLSMTSTYKVIGIDAFGCKSQQSKTVIVNALPAKPIVTRFKNVLISSYNTNNQWYIGSQKVDTAINRSFFPPFNSFYSVRYTDSKGCQSESDQVQFEYVSIPRIDLSSFIKLYPNPSQGWVMIEQVNGETIQLEVYSSDAQHVMSKQIEGTQLIDLRDLSPGVYVFRFTAEKGVSEMKIVID
jgi:hypothetical protein